MLCGKTSKGTLSAQAQKGRVLADIRLDALKTGLWTVKLVQNSKTIWSATPPVAAGKPLFISHDLPDAPGPDTITVDAFDPKRVRCSATIRL